MGGGGCPVRKVGVSLLLLLLAALSTIHTTEAGKPALSTDKTSSTKSWKLSSPITTSKYNRKNTVYGLTERASDRDIRTASLPLERPARDKR
ncbi:hypothetical protein Pmani_031882 [Petrolisthes manimaculis]|uniref:Uncharacterized protein n=1 Tax=Petrolisthes manimaculis TaxID=1843537 RepID=A0AAE1NTS1_9EUCA|nr:hypothetical protein Pmani_031882 [Petrolisthes manimaculis]